MTFVASPLVIIDKENRRNVIIQISQTDVGRVGVFIAQIIGDCCRENDGVRHITIAVGVVGACHGYGLRNVPVGRGER